MSENNKAPLIKAHESLNKKPVEPKFELEKQASWAAARMLAIALLFSLGIVLAIWGASKIHNAHKKEVLHGHAVPGGLFFNRTMYYQFSPVVHKQTSEI